MSEPRRRVEADTIQGFNTRNLFSKISLHHPPATIFTISSRSPALSRRRENSDGATASPLCSTTTLRGNRFCATRNSSIEHGSFASIGFPLAVICFCEGITYLQI